MQQFPALRSLNAFQDMHERCQLLLYLIDKLDFQIAIIIHLIRPSAMYIPSFAMRELVAVPIENFTHVIKLFCRCVLVSSPCFPSHCK